MSELLQPELLKPERLQSGLLQSEPLLIPVLARKH